MSIGSTIKKLRREHDMTQEQLAEYLGITANAVSQWECNRTAPDISQLPILANIFEVTTDYLLEVDVSRKKSNIESIRNEAWDLCNSGDKEGAVRIIKKALLNYPNEYTMMYDLLVFLYQRAFHQECSKNEFDELCSEAADLIDVIVTGSNDMETYSKCVELACCIFPVVGRKDDALKLIDNIPTISKDEILSSLYTGDKLIEHLKDSICKTVSTAGDKIIRLASLIKDDGCPEFDEEAKIILYEKSISFYKTLYEAGDYFFDAESLAEAEKRISNIFALRKDVENTLLHLRECVKYTVLFDTYDGKKEAYSSLIPFGRSPVCINWNNGHNTSYEMLTRLNNDTDYDFLRSDTEFNNLLKKLSQVAH